MISPSKGLDSERTSDVLVQRETREGWHISVYTINHHIANDAISRYN